MLNNVEDPPKKKSWYKLDIEAFKPVEVPHKFWKLKPEDIFPCCLMLFISCTSCLISMLISDPYAPLCYWDGPNYYYIAKRLYNVPEDNPWTKYFKYPRSYLACHLPGYPLAIRILGIPFFDNVLLGYISSIILIPVAYVYVFRRLLSLYGCVEDPSFSAVLISIIPLRYSVYHSTGASEPLYMTFAALSYIFFKTDQTLPMCLCISGCLLTRIDGLAVWGTIGLCYLLQFKIKKCFCVGFCLITDFLILAMHQVKFGEWNAYFKFNQGNQRIISHHFFNDLRNMFYANFFESSLYLFIPFIVCVACTFKKCLPYAIQGVVYVIYVSLLFHLDVFRYSLPGFLPCLIIGLDPFFSSKSFRKHSKVALSILGALAIYYSAGHICSNRPPAYFFKELMAVPKVYI